MRIAIWNASIEVLKALCYKIWFPPLLPPAAPLYVESWPWELSPALPTLLGLSPAGPSPSAAGTPGPTYIGASVYQRRPVSILSEPLMMWCSWSSQTWARRSALSSLPAINSYKGIWLKQKFFINSFKIASAWGLVLYLDKNCSL